MAREPTAIDRHPVWAVLGAIVAATVIAGVVLAFIWDWNWFRPMVEKKLAAELQRPVTLAHFDVRHALSAQPELVLDNIAIGNPPSFPAGTDAPHQLPPSAPHVAGTPAPPLPPQQATAPNP